MSLTTDLRKQRRRIGLAHVLAPAALSALTLLAACGNRAGAAPEQPTPEVGVVEITPQAYAPTVSLPGRVTAFETSEVRPQIGGIVRRRAFQEGAQVRAGQLLYEIDPAQASAALTSAEAAAATAQARYERYQHLIDIHAISQQEFDDARAASDQASAALQTARINLTYTRVTAPISGVIGVSNVTPGALATPAQATPFAVIQQIDRVYVDMSRSIAELTQLRGGASSPRSSATVQVTLPDGSVYPVSGQLQFSDVTVNESTGTVTLRALFPNPDHVLLPGMFVQAAVTQSAQQQAILAPQRGISRNAHGDAVALVVNGQGVVEERTLQTGATEGENWVVLSGLQAGDKLIVEGSQRVHPGAHARPVPVQTDAEAAAPPATAPLRGTQAE